MSGGSFYLGHKHRTREPEPKTARIIIVKWLTRRVVWRTTIVGLALAVLALATIFVVGLWIPLCRSEMQVTNCRVCAVSQVHDKRYVMGIRIRYSIGEVRRSAWTDMYDEYVAEPHEHQWANGFRGTDTSYWWRGGLVGCGMNGFDYYVTRYALSAAQLQGANTKQNRCAVFHQVLAAKDWNELAATYRSLGMPFDLDSPILKETIRPPAKASVR